MNIELIGVYPIEADEPVHLLELRVQGDLEAIDLAEFTQEVPGQPQENWQVPWDEHFLVLDGTAVVNPEEPDAAPAVDEYRLAFYFHHLDLSRPLVTPAGPISLPITTEKPTRLNLMEYESPY